MNVDALCYVGNMLARVRRWRQLESRPARSSSQLNDEQGFDEEDGGLLVDQLSHTEDQPLCHHDARQSDPGRGGMPDMEGHSGCSSVDTLGVVAALAAEDLRQECEAGLLRVRYLMTFMMCVTAVIVPVVAVCEWTIIESRRGDLAKDWWKCLVNQNVLLHWIESTQRYKLPGVLSALLYQACLFAWVSIIVYQRACIRMDWISSCIINAAYTLLLILLPPLSTAWCSPSAVTASLVTLFDYLWPPDAFDSVPEPNRCAKAHAFSRLCLCLATCCALANACCLLLVIRAESIRRRAVAAEKRYLAADRPLENDAAAASTAYEPPGRNDATASPNSVPAARDEKRAGPDSLLEQQGLAHRLCCTDAAPREIVFGAIVFITYVIVAAARASMLIVGQRSFNSFTRQREISVTVPGNRHDEPLTQSVSGGTTLIGAAPSLAFGPTLAMLSFASILRGFSGDDLANYRIAALLAIGALLVDVPSLSALIHGVLQRRLWKATDLHHCVHYYIRGKGIDLYGFPSIDRARTMCRCILIDFYAACIHVVFVAAMAVASIRTFTLNHRSFDNVVMPAPDSSLRGSMHLLQTSDDTGFEYDLAAPPLPHRRSAGQREVLGRYSAIIVRPRQRRHTSESSALPEVHRSNSTPLRAAERDRYTLDFTSFSANNSPRNLGLNQASQDASAENSRTPFLWRT